VGSSSNQLATRSRRWVFRHHDLDDDHGDHHKHWHDKMRKKMEAAHACHKKCGKDAACHSKCPKPWALFVKACQDWPAIKACHSTCKDGECDKCSKFDMEWMNKKFAKHPELVSRKADAKCPMIEKAHACHKEISRCLAEIATLLELAWMRMKRLHV
jgi:hypothetical protein